MGDERPGDAATGDAVPDDAASDDANYSIDIFIIYRSYTKVTSTGILSPTYYIQ